MASPYSVPAHDAMHYPPPAQVHEGVGDGLDGIPRRPMRIKVLYTFDDQNKSNCLARLPHPLNIPTVRTDDTTEIGVMELKQCILAIASAR